MRTWESASDECCARGGQLATFLDQDLLLELRNYCKIENIMEISYSSDTYF